MPNADGVVVLLLNAEGVIAEPKADGCVVVGAKADDEEAKAEGVLAKAEVVVFPNAEGVVVLPNAGGAVVLPNTDGVDVLPNADGVDVLPKADGVVVLPKADVVVELSKADGVVLPNADVPPNADCGVDVLPKADVVPLPNADVVAVTVEAPSWLASRAGKLLCLTAWSYAWVRLERAFA